MKVTTLGQFENGIGRVAEKITQCETALANKLDSTGKAETAGTADNAISDGEGNVIASTYLKKTDNVSVDLSNYITKTEASSTYLAKTALNIISAVPVQSGTITYDGSAKTPAWLNYDTSKLQISGDYQNKTNVGTYPVGFKPISPYTWSNGTQELKNGTWAIGKAVGSLSLSAESGSVNIDTTKTFTVNRAGDGAITATSSNSNVASVSVNGNTVTITGKAAGSATITVQVAEGTNHFAPANKTYAVTVTKIPLSLSASISGTVTYNTTGTINISGNAGGGAVTATSANSSCVTVSNTTTSTVTVKCANYSTTATQITINVAETTKYASGTCTCNVTTAKAEPTLTLSAESISLSPFNPSATVTVNTNSSGTLSVSSENSAVCAASIDNQKISISANSRGSTNVSVFLDESNNFVSITKTILVSTSNTTVNLLANRTLAQLQTLIRNGQAPYYLNEGDYFDITFPSAIQLEDNFVIDANSTYRAVCIGINHNPTIEGYNRVHFAIIKDTDNKNIFFGGKAVHNNGKGTGWQDTDLRNWLNDTFYNSLPSNLKAVISPCTKYTDNVHNTTANNDPCVESQVTATSDKIWLLAPYEVYGDYEQWTLYNPYEKNKQTPYNYFLNGNGKDIRQFKYDGDANYVATHWSRSPYRKNGEFDGAWLVLQPNFSGGDGGRYGFIPCFTIA